METLNLRAWPGGPIPQIVKSTAEASVFVTTLGIGQSNSAYEFWTTRVVRVSQHRERIPQHGHMDLVASRL